MKKTVYTLSVDNYSSEITNLTFPLMKNWADKIGAEFHVITERKFPEWPPTYEKLQIHQLGQEHKNDWNIFFDADCLVHPDFFDPTTVLSKDTVMFAAFDLAPVRFRTNNWFLRDGRNIGTSNWFAVGSDWCLDLWKPWENGTLKDILPNMKTTKWEEKLGMPDKHLVDDYVLSCNLSRYGIKATTLSATFKKFYNTDHSYKFGTPEDHLFHDYGIPKDKRKETLANVVEKWGLKI
jgi:hypothetical protein